jgi:hypothetical protein
MPDDMMPFIRMVSLSDGTIPNAPQVQTRHLSDLEVVSLILGLNARSWSRNPIIFDIYEATQNPTLGGKFAVNRIARTMSKLQALIG